MSNNGNEQYVKRFNKGFIISHWVNVAAFFILFLSALPMYTEWFDWVWVIFGGPENARLVHRIAAVGFILPVFILIFFDREGLKRWAKNLFTWGKHDFEFLKEFPKEFFGGAAKPIKQDFFNAGEKINSWLQIIMWGCLVGSGFMMWFADHLPQGIVMWAYPVHNIGAALAGAVAIGHIYMSIALARASLRGMTKGDVTIEYAKEHHGRWYDELQEEKKLKKDA